MSSEKLEILIVRCIPSAESIIEKDFMQKLLYPIRKMEDREAMAQAIIDALESEDVFPSKDEIYKLKKEAKYPTVIY